MLGQFKLVLFLIGFFCSHADASTLFDLIKKELNRFYPETQIELVPTIHWTSKAEKEPTAISFLEDDSKGNAHFYTFDEDQNRLGEGYIHFSAWKVAKIASRRIYPGEILRNDFFEDKKIDLALGQGHEFRGIILSSHLDVTQFEAKQTLLEGNFLLSSAIQKIPDIRKGDSVRIRLVSGDLTLSVLGIAQETGYLNQGIRVMTGKTKREFVGKLRTDGVVEVKI